MASLPSVLLTSLTWKAESDIQSSGKETGALSEIIPSIADKVIEYDPKTEIPIFKSELRAKQQSEGSFRKRLRLQAQTTPSTPGSGSGASHDDNDDDDGSSVGGGSIRSGHRGSNKWQFDEISSKLQAAYWELNKLSEVLGSKEAVMTRLERIPLNHDEKHLGLELGILKRTDAFTKADSIITKGLENLEREIKYQREYMNQLDKITQKWRLVCPNHKFTVLTSLKPEERLAINLESGLNDESDLVLLSRTSPTYGGVSLSAMNGKERDEGDFRAHALHAQIISVAPPYKVLGQASTALGSVVASPAETQSPANLTISFDQIVPVDAEVSIDNRIESRFRDGHARAMMRRVGANHELKLGQQYILRFQLLPEASFNIINSYDAICSLALNLLERDKTSGTIQAVCLQKLLFPLYVEELAKTPGISGVYWQHDEDNDDSPEKVQSRCCMDLGRSGKYGCEFTLCGGEFAFDWSSVPGYRPKFVRPLTVVEALEVATELSSIALVNELATMITKGSICATKRKASSFQVIDRSREDLLLFSVEITVVMRSQQQEQQQQYHQHGVVSNVIPSFKVLVQFPDGASTTSSEDISESPYYLLRQVLAMQLPQM